MNTEAKKAQVKSVAKLGLSQARALFRALTSKQSQSVKVHKFGLVLNPNLFLLGWSSLLILLFAGCTPLC